MPVRGSNFLSFLVGFSPLVSLENKPLIDTEKIMNEKMSKRRIQITDLQKPTMDALNQYKSIQYLTSNTTINHGGLQHDEFNRTHGQSIIPVTRNNQKKRQVKTCV